MPADKHGSDRRSGQNGSHLLLLQESLLFTKCSPRAVSLCPQGSGTQMQRLGSGLPGPVSKREGEGQARSRFSGMGTGLMPGIQ